ncbi:hypothetical protein AAFN47_06215 [Hoeflea sp. CAU 1731]
MSEKLTGRQVKQGDQSPSLAKALLFGLAAAALVWVGVEIYGYALKGDTEQLEELTDEQSVGSDNMSTGSVERTSPDTQTQTD